MSGEYMENLEVISSQADESSVLFQGSRDAFLSAYAIHTEGRPAVNVGYVSAAPPGENYNFTIEISPVEGSRISAVIPIQGAELGWFTGGVFGRDVPRQIGIILGDTKYVVYENPKQLAESVVGPTAAKETAFNQRMAAMDGEDPYLSGQGFRDEHGIMR